MQNVCVLEPCRTYIPMFHTLRHLPQNELSPKDSLYVSGPCHFGLGRILVGIVPRLC
jgi:hypothetical protein